MAIAAAASRTGPDGTALLTGPFATALGPVSFDPKGDLAENPYRLFRYDGTRFVPLESQ